MYSTLTWAALLEGLDALEPEFPHVFFASCPTSAAETCLVADDDEFEGDEDVPEVASEAGLTKSLLVSDVQQVVANLTQQVPDASIELVLRAIAFYVERDAFIEW